MHMLYVLPIRAVDDSKDRRAALFLVQQRDSLEHKRKNQGAKHFAYSAEAVLEKEQE
jgi:hypothetical protein